MKINNWKLFNMKLISLSRVTRFGFKNFWRNGWLSFATTLIMVLTLFFISTLIILNILLGLTLNSFKEKIDISIYFEPEVSEKDLSGLQNELESMREVKSLEIISKEKAIEIFNEKHKSNPEITALLAELEENPFQVSLIVKAQNPEDYAIIADRLEDTQYKNLIDKVTYEDNKTVIQKITNISNTISRVGLIVGLVFSFVAIIFMFNTIRMTIFTQREEIKIMRLVGATSAFVRMPFIVEGVLYGVIASFINTSLLYFALKYLSPKFLQFIGSPSLDLFAYFTFHIIIIILLQIVIASFLGIVSSIVATWRYLRV